MGEETGGQCFELRMSLSGAIYSLLYICYL